MGYALVQRELRPPSVEALRRAFCVIPELASADASFMARNAFGLLAEDIPLDLARAVKSALRAEGVDTAIVDQQNLDSPPAVRLKRGACLQEGFVAYDTLGRATTVPWPRVYLVSAGGVGVVEVRRVEERYPSYDTTSSGPVVEVSYKEEERLRLMLDVFLDAEPGRYRVTAQEFGYGYLGPRLRRSSTENFVLLVRDLMRYATAAGANRGAVSLNQDPPQTFAYRSVRAFEAESIWLLWGSRGRPEVRE